MIARLFAVVGAVGSFGFFWRAGQRTPPFLLAMMAIWVMAPFVGVFAAGVVSKRWSEATRATLDVVSVVIAVGAVVIYGTGFKPSGTPAGFLYVIVPAASWLVGVSALGIAAATTVRR